MLLLRVNDIDTCGRAGGSRRSRVVRLRRRLVCLSLVRMVVVVMMVPVVAVMLVVVVRLMVTMIMM